MIAVVEQGGKQFVVTPNEKIQAEKISGEAGATVAFDNVLLVADENGDSVTFGSGSVTGTITRQFRTRKIMVRKFKNKVRYHRTAGHRQQKTEIEITKIG